MTGNTTPTNMSTKINASTITTTNSIVLTGNIIPGVIINGNGSVIGPADVNGRSMKIGDRVGVAFSANGSVGRIRIGVLEEMNGPNSFRVRWEKTNELSPKMTYGSQERWVIL